MTPFAANKTSSFVTKRGPSAVLSTDLNLDASHLQQLRDRWNEQAKGLSAGGTPILTHGLRVLPWATNMAKDLQVAEQLKLANENIALVFTIPLAILGLGGAPLGATEQLMKTWLSLGLGFCLNHVEEAFGKLFGLAGQPDEYCEFDTAALLRSDLKDKIEALARAVQSSILSPNEAAIWKATTMLIMALNRERKRKTFRCLLLARYLLLLQRPLRPLPRPREIIAAPCGAMSRL